MPIAALGFGMRISRFVLLTLIGVSWSCPAPAQLRGDFARCRSIEDDARRLECYDRIGADATPSIRSKYEVVELRELKAFPLSYRGDLVEVRGFLVPTPDIFDLKLDEGDTRPFPVNVESLSRHTLELVTQACGPGCPATVRGKVGPLAFVTGIIADSIE